jgi:aspartate-semialdehyde dehydrogenase
VLESANLAAQVGLFSTEDAARIAVIKPAHESAQVMALLNPEVLSSTGLVMLAGSSQSAVKALELAKRADPRPTIIDLTGTLEDDTSARLRAPVVETPDHPAPAPIQVIAHPAAIALALLLKQLHAASPIRRSVVLAFEPASERGQHGLDELQQQTVSLLSFKKLNQDVYDSQVAFNLLARYGEEAPISLEAIESKIDRHLASLLASTGTIAIPSLRVVQAPVFHGYSFSIWVEFEQNPGPDALRAALASPHIEVRGGQEESPSNVGAAGQNGITVGEISIDRNHPRACWFWVVADNLRLAAENALEVAREALA